MKIRSSSLLCVWLPALFLASPFAGVLGASSPAIEKRLLYVATPGIRNYLEYGGHGVLVYDISNGHKLLKRIPSAGLDAQGKPHNVKGVCASGSLKRLYITTPRAMHCIDLMTEKVLWEKTYEGGCDRMAISPDGLRIFLPSFESDHWHIVDASTGEVIKKVVPKSGAHNTVCGLNGQRVYLAGLKSPLLNILDTKTQELIDPAGPFSAAIRPFTVNGAQTRCYVNVNELLGFEIGDLRTGRKLHRIEVQGYEKGPVKRHGCPSHGIGLTPDEKEIWVTDAANSKMHVFDNTAEPPRQVASLTVRDQPGWITFSMDGRYAYPSTGEVIDVKTRQTLTALQDEKGAPVQSEKMLELQFLADGSLRPADQFGVGRVAPN